MCSHHGRNGFNHTTAFSTKCLEKSLCNFTGTIFLQSENHVVSYCAETFECDTSVSYGMLRLFCSTTSAQRMNALRCGHKVLMLCLTDPCSSSFCRIATRRCTRTPCLWETVLPTRPPTAATRTTRTRPWSTPGRSRPVRICLNKTDNDSLWRWVLVSANC